MRQQFRLAWRVISRRPILSTVIALTIGSALAAATVAFAIVDGVLLERLPYANQDRLVTVWERTILRDSPRNVVSPANFIAWREGLKSFDQMTSLVQSSVSLAGDGEPERLGAIVAGAQYFSLTGAVPLAGRFYTEAEDVEGGPSVVVLGEGIWRRRFNADPSIVGRSILINGTPREVLGVLPQRFDFSPRYSFSSMGERAFWFPSQHGERARTWSGRYLQVLGRLAPGATVQSAQLEATALAARLRQQFPERMEGWDVSVVPLRQEIVGDVRSTVLIVFAAVAMVVLIACANVANLLLGRAAERQQEMAVRAALGAGRGALIRQLMTESLLLTGLGGLAGLALASWGIGALVRSGPDLPRLDAIGLDGGVIGFSLIATLVASVLIGVIPALELSRRGPASWLTQRGTASRHRARRFRSGLVAAQVALSFILLAGAGLLIRSLVNRLSVDLGIDPANVVTGEISLSGPGYQDTARRTQFFESVVERVRALPGVERASLASVIPLSSDNQATGFRALDRPIPPAGQSPVADVRFVEHDYLRTMGVRLLAGEFMDGRDRLGAPIRVIINETGARSLWPGGNAVGQRISMEWGDTLIAEIAGVVEDVQHRGADSDQGRITLYWDYRQLGEEMSDRMVLVVRGARPEALVPAIRAQVKELDPTIPVFNVRTMESLVTKSTSRARFTTVALGLFAGLALLLAGLGVYGVITHATQQRTREIGIRLALGSSRGAVTGMILREGGAVVLPAIVIGLIGALGLTRLLRTLIYGVSPGDPVTLLGVTGVLTVVAFWACFLPARRAAAIDPAVTIRND